MRWRAPEPEPKCNFMVETDMSEQPLHSYPPQAIAIVGLAGRFPDARSLDDFWRNIRAGRESLETFDDADLDAAGVSASQTNDKQFVRRGTTLEDAELFDARFFGMSPREAQILDPQHRIFLECAWEALENAGYAPGATQKRVGVYAGSSMNTYLFAQILRDPALIDAVGGYQLMLGNDKDFLCTRVSYKLDLRGPSMNVQTACSTSLVAVEVACRALQIGACDMALAGGVSVSFPQRAGYLYQDGMILSPDGHCRPFDAAASGTRGGAGAGIVVLKRLADALADRDTVHAVIRGAAINNDGARKAGYTAPSIDGQVEVIAAAQALAGVDPRSIGYAEAHGTATPLGDPIEIAALTRVFRATTSDIGFCRLGSLKANLGHLDAAAGVASLIKTVLALTHREFPPLANFRSPNPQLDLAHSPFTVSTEASVWPDGDGPRRAGVSSFGIGGTNAHVVLEEGPAIASPTSRGSQHLLVLSAKTETALEQATVNLADRLEGQPEVSLSDVAWTLQIGRQAFAHRRALVAQDVAQAVRALRCPRQGPALSAVHEGGTRPVAFLFSGQGSQHVGMGAALYDSEPHYRDAMDRCAALFEPHLGLDIRAIIFADDSSDLINETRYAQPALFCSEYALATLWMQWGVSPYAMIGHSIGEYVAAHLAGVFSLADVVAVVAARGRLMQALPPGTMAAVHLPASELAPRLGDGVEIAAENAPGLCTISGAPEPMANVLRRLEARGVDCRPLHTSHAFHSSMMDPALPPFVALLQDIPLSPPSIPYVSNVTGVWITADQATAPDYYATHLRQPVRFESGIRTLAADPALFFLEVGPGNALATLTRATLGQERASAITSSLSRPRGQENDRRTILEAAGKLWLSGAVLAWPDMHAGETPRRIPLPTYPFERTRYAVDAAPRASAIEAGAGSGQMERAAPGRLQHLYAPTWTRDESISASEPRVHGVWIVFADRAPLADALVARLQDAGATPIVVEAGASYGRFNLTGFQMRPDDPDDVATLVHDINGLHGPIAGAILLWDLLAEDSAWAGPPTRGYAALVAVAAGLDALSDSAPIQVITVSVGAQSVLDEPVVRPDAALLFGPVIVLPTEVPGIRIRSVDIEMGDAAPGVPAIARMLVAEAAADGDENFVAWRRGRRWVRRFQPVSLPAVDPAKLPTKHRGAYLITGGLGGIGLALAAWLAKVASARLLLTSRRSMPPRQAWDALLGEPAGDEKTVAIVRAIRGIEAEGGEVMTAAADAADLAAMATAIGKARECWGGLDGVIHAAGVPGNGRIAVLQDEQEIRSVLAPKMGGLGVLMQLLGDRELDFVALMSSISSVIGSPGTCGYAAANAAFDSFVESARRPPAWKQVVAVNWAAWRDTGMAANLLVPDGVRAARDAFLSAGIATGAGVDAFARILGSRRRRVIMTSDDLEAPFTRGSTSAVLLAPGNRTAQAHSSAPGASSAADRGEARDPPVTDTEKTLATIWTELIGVTGLGANDDFFELGGHSLLATRVLSRVTAALGVRLALRDIFDAPTIGSLAQRIDAISGQRPSAMVEASDDREEILI
jgi:phthiocerol/phenolphthiocerol synthesis type-I polyketide synthase E